MKIDILISPLTIADKKIKSRELTRLLTIGCNFYVMADDEVKRQIELDVAKIDLPKSLRCRFNIDNVGRLGEEIQKTTNRNLMLQRFYITAKYLLNQDQKIHVHKSEEVTNDMSEDEYIVPISKGLSDFFT
ncbi:hypothetical protein CTM88_20105 [Photobacterium aquimaris]|uniref:Uncharacterized protein n=1 Tax=Photobacterium aquimaris TaxID=512643 RepID=A0A2T3IEN2_9GAMM|nr:hypothetical protein [Photobacterium aquimaris]OBU19993.1 hypothetical protein AYY20_16810 [Photobacterium aquimaris]PSU22955.1 hypothetical protein CTM88_20105 [Photobacterium aquimaris]